MNIFCSAICKSMVVIYQVIVNLIFCLLCRLYSYFTTKTFKGLDCKIVNFSLSVCVTRSLVLCVCFVDRCLSFCTFPFGHCVVCSYLIYGFWLPLWYLQTLPCLTLIFKHAKQVIILGTITKYTKITNAMFLSAIHYIFKK
jgi:hypothetical protein